MFEPSTPLQKEILLLEVAKCKSIFFYTFKYIWDNTVLFPFIIITTDRHSTKWWTSFNENRSRVGWIGLENTSNQILEGQWIRWVWMLRQATLCLTLVLTWYSAPQDVILLLLQSLSGGGKVTTTGAWVVHNFVTSSIAACTALTFKATFRSIILFWLQDMQILYKYLLVLRWGVLVIFQLCIFPPKMVDRIIYRCHV